MTDLETLKAQQAAAFAAWQACPTSKKAEKARLQRELDAVGPLLAQRGLVGGRQGRRIAQPGQTHLGGGRRGFRFLVGIVGHEGGQPL